MTDALSMDPATMEAQAATVRVPERPRVSEQIGCSDLAPLLVGYMVARMGRGHVPTDALPQPIAEWLNKAASRAHRWSEKPVPAELRGMPAVWCSERARLVQTPAGPLPEIVAEHAGLRARATMKPHMQAGLDLEPSLWAKWMSRDREMEWAAYSMAGIPRRLADRTRSAVHRHPDAPLENHPDGWGGHIFGASVVVNCKTTMKRKTQPDPPAWIQVQGEMEVTDSDLAVLPHGILWLDMWKNTDSARADRRMTDSEIAEIAERGEVVAMWVERDERVGRALAEFSKRAVEWIHQVADAAMKGTVVNAH